MNDNSQQLPWYRQIAAVIPRYIYIKSIGTTLFIFTFFGAYFYLLKSPAYPATVMPVIFLDRMISFQPQALPMYISLWVYVSLPSALLATRREMFVYGMSMAVTCTVGLVIFYFWPTVVPVANIDWTQYPDVNLLKSMDASGNASPSLHVATAIFSGIWLHHLLRSFTAPQWILILNWGWCIGIIYSTIATRQHVALDVLAGLALGALTAYLALQKMPKGSAVSFPVES